MTSGSQVVIGDEQLVWPSKENSNAETEHGKAERAGRRFNDSTFLLSDKDNNYGNTDEQIYSVLDGIEDTKDEKDVEKRRTFVDEPGPDDIAQGEAGDCWFLSSLCSIVNVSKAGEKEGYNCLDPNNDPKKALSQVVDSRNQNSKTGCYLFNFYRMGEWKKVVVDDKLPLKIFETKRKNGKLKRGNTFSPEHVDEYWALLLEKAFAKLAGGYMNLEGGFPRCALTFLTGGITTSDMIDSKELAEEARDVFPYLKTECEKKNILCNASNYGNEGDDNGLIAGHAYSVENFITIRGQNLVQLRNPWGEGEWTGDWSDEWINVIRPPLTNEEKQALEVDDDNTNDDDGCFWMTWNDFICEFENLAVCHLPEKQDYERRVRGTFRYGVNAPGSSEDMCKNYLNSDQTFQFKLTVQGKTEKNFKFQLLLDLPVKPSEDDKRLVFFGVHKAESSKAEDTSKFGLYKSELVFPKLPLQRKTTEFKGYKFEQYDYNGWVYNLMPGKYYIVLATSPIGKTAVKDTQFMFRIRGPAQNGQPLYKWEEI